VWEHWTCCGGHQLNVWHAQQCLHALATHLKSSAAVPWVSVPSQTCIPCCRLTKPSCCSCLAFSSAVGAAAAAALFAASSASRAACAGACCSQTGRCAPPVPPLCTASRLTALRSSRRRGWTHSWPTLLLPYNGRYGPLTEAAAALTSPQVDTNVLGRSVPCRQICTSSDSALTSICCCTFFSTGVSKDIAPQTCPVLEVTWGGCGHC